MAEQRSPSAANCPRSAWRTCLTLLLSSRKDRCFLARQATGSAWYNSDVGVKKKKKGCRGPGGQPVTAEHLHGLTASLSERCEKEKEV